MNNINLKNTIENLIDTFLEAGKIAKIISEQGVKITIKSDKSPVTNGDIAVDNILKKKNRRINTFYTHYLWGNRKSEYKKWTQIFLVNWPNWRY